MSRRSRARRALLDALGPELAGQFEQNAPELITMMADAITSGLYTATEAAQALTVCDELATATDSGEITPEHGYRLVALDALRLRGDRRPD